MKMLMSLMLLSMSLDVQAAQLGNVRVYDGYTGVYQSKDKKAYAIVAKKLFKQGDLINEPEYKYVLYLEDDKGPENFLEMDLEPAKNENSLVGTYDGECDDPGCMDTDFEVEIKNRTLKWSYEWYRYPDGDEDESGGSEERELVRLYEGVETVLAQEEPLKAQPLMKMAYAGAVSGIKKFSEFYKYDVDASLKDSSFNVYKKVFKSDGKLEALFVSTKTKYRTDDGHRGPAECLSVVVRKEKWRVPFTRCTLGAFPIDERF